MTRAMAVCLLALAGAGAGCLRPKPAVTALPAPPEPVLAVDHMDLQASPVASNWDNRPGPDGLVVRVFFYRIDPKTGQTGTVTVSGSLQFLLYEGKVSPQEASAAQPFQVWAFLPEQLPVFLGRSLGLWGYQMQLAWADHVPRSDSVTLVARYQPPEGPPMFSMPANIAMGLK